MTKLDRIEQEIRYYQELSDYSYWQIGARLNQVKYHHLSHGQFLQWVDRLGMSRFRARQMMRVAKRLSPSEAFKKLNLTALNEIALMPASERADILEKGDLHPVYQMTTREIRQYRKGLRLKAKQRPRGGNIQPRTHYRLYTLEHREQMQQIQAKDQQQRQREERLHDLHEEVENLVLEFPLDFCWQQLQECQELRVIKGYQVEVERVVQWVASQTEALEFAKLVLQQQIQQQVTHMLDVEVG